MTQRSPQRACLCAPPHLSQPRTLARTRALPAAALTPSAQRRQRRQAGVARDACAVVYVCVCVSRRSGRAVAPPSALPRHRLAARAECTCGPPPPVGAATRRAAARGTLPKLISICWVSSTGAAGGRRRAAACLEGCTAHAGVLLVPQRATCRDAPRCDAFWVDVDVARGTACGVKRAAGRHAGLRVAQLHQGSSCGRRVLPHRYGSSQHAWGRCRLGDARCR